MVPLRVQKCTKKISKWGKKSHWALVIPPLGFLIKPKLIRFIICFSSGQLGARALIKRAAVRRRLRRLGIMKVPREELMSDILKRLTGESALPVYSNVEKFRRGKDGSYYVAEDFTETVKKRELVNAKERMRVRNRWT